MVSTDYGIEMVYRLTDIDMRDFGKRFEWVSELLPVIITSF